MVSQSFLNATRHEATWSIYRSREVGARNAQKNYIPTEVAKNEAIKKNDIIGVKRKAKVFLALTIFRRRGRRRDGWMVGWIFRRNLIGWMDGWLKGLIDWISPGTISRWTRCVDEVRSFGVNPKDILYSTTTTTTSQVTWEVSNSPRSRDNSSFCSRLAFFSI